MKKLLLTGILVMTISTNEASASRSFNEGTNLSHAERNTLAGAIESIANKITRRGDLPHASVKRQLELLEELSQFDLGRFLLVRGGLNGYWTDYIINHPKQSRLLSANQPFNPLESFLLNQAPTVVATQQRFDIFKRVIQDRIHDGIALASVPCGLTADLFDLNFSQATEFSICGIDIDAESLNYSRKKADDLGLADRCEFIQADAWHLGCVSRFDVISSNGLSIYEPDNARVIELYRQFFLALKPNGCLVTSFLTLPPIPGLKTEWDLHAVNPEHALLQKIIFSDILDCKWQIYRSEELVKSQLLEAGFTEIKVFYDKARIFPTITATRA